MSVTSKSALAAELGISKARVSQYLKRGMPVLPDGKLDRERALRWIVQSHYKRYGGDHGAARARDLITDGYAGEREPGDPLRYALKPDGSTEWYRLDPDRSRGVGGRGEQRGGARLSPPRRGGGGGAPPPPTK